MVSKSCHPPTASCGDELLDYLQKARRQKTFIQYEQAVIAQILFAMDQEADSEVPVVELLVRLTEKHFPDVIPPLKNKPRAQKRRRVFWVRDKVRCDVRYHCPDCPTQPRFCFPA